MEPTQENVFSNVDEVCKLYTNFTSLLIQKGYEQIFENGGSSVLLCVKATIEAIMELEELLTDKKDHYSYDAGDRFRRIRDLVESISQLSAAGLLSESHVESPGVASNFTPSPIPTNQFKNYLLRVATAAADISSDKIPIIRTTPSSPSRTRNYLPSPDVNLLHSPDDEKYAKFQRKLEKKRQQLRHLENDEEREARVTSFIRSQIAKMVEKKLTPKRNQNQSQEAAKSVNVENLNLSI